MRVQVSLKTVIDVNNDVADTCEILQGFEGRNGKGKKRSSERRGNRVTRVVSFP